MSQAKRVLSSINSVINEDDSNALMTFRSYMKSGWAFTPSTVVPYSGGSTTLGKLFNYLKNANPEITSKFLKDFSDFATSNDDSRPGGTAVLRFLGNYIKANNIQ